MAKSAMTVQIGTPTTKNGEHVIGNEATPPRKLSRNRTPLRLLTLGCVTALAATTPGTASAEPAAPVEDLGQPLSDVLLIGGDVGPGPGGETVIWSASSSTPAVLNAVDPDTGEVVEAFPMEGAEGSWAVEVAADGSVYVGTYGSAHLFRWTEEDGLLDLGNPPQGSGDFVHDLTSDENGVVYGGMSPNGAYFSYDPRTEKFRDYGRLSDADYVRSVEVVDGTLFAGTSRPSTIFAIDPDSGESEKIPAPPDADPEAEYVYDLDSGDGYLYARYGEAFPDDLFVYDIEAAEWAEHIELAHGLSVSAPGPDGIIYLIADGALHSYDPATGDLQATDVPFTGRVANARGIGWAELDDPDFPGESIVGLLWRGTMFRYSPQTGAFDFIETNIEGTPIPVTSLAEGPDGTMHAGGFLSGGFATFDLGSGALDSFQRFAQMENMVTVGDRLYLGTYPGARLYEYDPEAEWNSPEYSPATDEDVPENPRQLLDLTDEEQVRAGALAAAGDYVALGTEPELDRYGGEFVIWDPASDSAVFQERGLIEDQSIIDLEYRDGIVYGGTSINGGYAATPPRAAEAVVFAWSLEDEELLWQFAPIADAPTIEDLAFDAEGTLWAVADDRLVSLDLDQQEVDQTVEGPDSAQQVVANPTDGLLYVDWGAAGLGWYDPATGGQGEAAPGDARTLATDSFGQVWFSVGNAVHRFATEPTDDGDEDQDDTGGSDGSNDDEEGFIGPGHTGSANNGGGSTDPSDEPAPGADSSLPATGVAHTVPLLVAALVIASLGVLVLRRRRTGL